MAEESGMEFLLSTQTSENSGLSPLVVLMVTVLVVGIGVVVMMHTRAKIARRNAEVGTPRERIEQIRNRAATEGKAEGLMVEMLETAQRLAAQIDSKAARLEALIDEADRRLAMLGSLDEDVDFTDRDESSSVGRIDLDPLTRQIHQLADEGLSPVEIAGRLEEATGKVELVLALRREQHSR